MEGKLTLNFIIRFNNLQLSDMATIKTVHMDIIEEERTAPHLQLVISYHRGLLNINARNFLPDSENIKNGKLKNLIMHTQLLKDIFTLLCWSRFILVFYFPVCPLVNCRNTISG